MGIFDRLFENSTLKSRWKRNYTYHSSFSIRPTYRGDHVFVFKGRAFSFSTDLEENVVVKTFYTERDRNNACKDYLMCQKKANEIAQKFNKLLDKTTSGSRNEVHFIPTAEAIIEDRALLTRYFYHIKFAEDESVLFEERLRGDFVRFVSIHGRRMTDCSFLLNAFCHYTLEQSGGQLVICGLKGIQDKKTGNFHLTNPTIHSNDKRFGYKDEGPEGIEAFRSTHKCTEMCLTIQQQVWASSEMIEKPFSHFLQPTAPIQERLELHIPDPNTDLNWGNHQSSIETPD